MSREPKRIITPNDIPSIAGALSGALGGAVANLAVFPLDLVTTRLQVQDKIDDGSLKKYRSVADAMVRILEEEGLLAFYDGSVQDTIATMISAFFYFFSYDHLRNLRLAHATINQKNGHRSSTLGVAEELIIGSLAGIFCKFFTSPLSNVVTRQQTAALIDQHNIGSQINADSTDKLSKKHPNHVSAWKVFKEIYQEKGITGYWTGFKATIVLSVNPSLTYYFYQSLIAHLIPRKRRGNPTGFEVFLFSAAAKTLASLITYPLILSKTRQQVKGASDNDSMITSMQKIIHVEGFSALYHGASGQIIKGFFSQGITMLVKDKIARLFIYLYFVFFRHRRTSL